MAPSVPYWNNNRVCSYAVYAVNVLLSVSSVVLLYTYDNAKIFLFFKNNSMFCIYDCITGNKKAL